MRRLPADLATIFGEVRTGRLVLRRLKESDGPVLFAVDGDPATHRYTPGGPAPDLASCEQRLRGWLAHWKEEGYGYWAVVLPQTEQVLGFGGVVHRAWNDRDVLNLYYRCTPSAWGHGYATELAQTAVALAQEYLPPWPVIALTRPGNIASMRTAERAGLLRRPDLDTEYIVFALNWPVDTLPSSSPRS
ncbi:GNAT family N-acetyltransferase [Dictyobacter kobayashii]|uniref:GNAT family acetyltransferase n=1 Tax=Dictyobacter kobayashii TaxID=2014872 RepID=A0A402ARU7_9CHLR|nr:GNAT family N-acetyltransferase [Dictyobacter kobayashii]GCE21825.1 GNAT family acetyltransferase [Dictyobacter kobayashii]